MRGSRLEAPVALSMNQTPVVLHKTLLHVRRRVLVREASVGALSA